MTTQRLLRRLWAHAPILFVAFAAIAIALAGPALQQALRYERDAILSGELWRLLTAHLVHLGPVHLALNLAGLVIVYGLFRASLTPLGWTLTLLVSALGTSLGLLAWNPEISWYVGLSGLLHGAFLAGALTELRHGRRFALVYIALLALKLLSEALWGPSPGTVNLIGGSVITAAHVYGALGGLVVALTTALLQYRTQPKK